MVLDLGLASSFLVLAEEGHYGRAAARLHLTSSALTKRIQRLERQLGVVLLQRSPAGVLRVTAAGLRFAEATGPLLAHAEAARQAARQGPSRYTVRIGLPGGARLSLAGIGLAKITHDLRRSYPEAHFTCREIPFAELDECLDDKTVDVLWTSAPVRNATVDSHPLNVDTALVGVVGARHRWAEAGSVDVGAFCDEPMLFNPAVSEEWMGPFWLADIRPRRDARLVETLASDHQHALLGVVGGDTVMTCVASAGPLLGPGLRAVTLIGAARMGFHAARRRADRRGAVLGLIEAFEAVPADTFAQGGT
jgi:DNA-binding transcriptional LysR family regulator